MKNYIQHKMFNFFLLFSFICMSHIIDLFILMQLLTIISSIDDQNYPEKTHTYFIVNAPYIFSACWKVRHYFLQRKRRRDFIPYGFLSCMVFLFNMAFEFLRRPQHEVKHSALAGCEATFTREDKKKSAGLTGMWTRWAVKCTFFIFVFLPCFFEQDF